MVAVEEMKESECINIIMKEWYNALPEERKAKYRAQQQLTHAIKNASWPI